VTVASHAGFPREIGAKMLVCDGGEFFGTIAEEFRAAGTSRSSGVLRSGEPRSHQSASRSHYRQCCGGTVALLIEILHRGHSSTFSGQGNVGRQFASPHGDTLSIHLIDSRPEWLYSLKFQATVVRHRNLAHFLSKVHGIQTEPIPWFSPTTLWIGDCGELYPNRRATSGSSERTKWLRFHSRLKSLASMKRSGEVTAIEFAERKVPKEIA